MSASLLPPLRGALSSVVTLEITGIIIYQLHKGTIVVMGATLPKAGGGA
jgi:hypothetical protein